MIKRLIISSCLSILIIVTFSLVVYSRSISKNGILKNLDDINYYDYTYNDVIDKLEKELPNKDLAYMYNKYVTREQIKKDIETILSSYYSNKDNNVKKDFYDNVIKNFDSQNDENVKLLVNNFTSVYYNDLFRIDKVMKKLSLGSINKGIIFVLLVVTIFFIVSGRRDISIYNSFLVSGLVFLVPKVFIILKDVLKNFYYYNNTLSYFIKMCGYNIIDLYLKSGLILIAIGLTGVTIHSFCKDN